MLSSHPNHTLLYARHPFWQPKYGYHALPRASYDHRSFLMAYLIHVIPSVVQRAGSPVASMYALCWSVVASRGVLARARGAHHAQMRAWLAGWLAGWLAASLHGRSADQDLRFGSAGNAWLECTDLAGCSIAWLIWLADRLHGRSVLDSLICLADRLHDRFRNRDRQQIVDLAAHAWPCGHAWAV